MTEHTRNRIAHHATCAAVTVIMIAWIICGAVINASEPGGFPRGF